MTSNSNDSIAPASWLREIASHSDYSQFRKLWHHPSTEQAEQGYLAACYEQVAKRANSEGEFFLANDAATQGLNCAARAQFPPHELMVQKITALARSGALGEALKAMDQFLINHNANSGILSAQARLRRDRALALSDEGQCKALYREAAILADQARQKATDEGISWAYAGTQEAQFHLFAGDYDVARARAHGLIAHVLDQPEEKSPIERMWQQITLADMYLILGNLDEAGRYYHAASAVGAGAPGDLAASRSAAKIVLEHLARLGKLGRPPRADASILDQWFKKPLILVFAGHLPDTPDRPESRLPESQCRPDGPLAAALAKRLDELQPVEGICASAPGSDILFAEAILARAASLALLDPFPESRIREAATTAGEDWLPRWQKVYKGANRTDPIACAEEADTGAQCEYATYVMLGSAILRARRINATLRALVVWDEKFGNVETRGGTWQFAALCHACGEKVELEVINCRTLQPGTCAELPPMDASINPIEIRSMLFADVVGFSRLPDSAYPGFMSEFMVAAEKILSEHCRADAEQADEAVNNTWGDAFFAVFKDPITAARAALALQKMTMESDWSERFKVKPGQADLKLRIGLHTGPVHKGRDPFQKRAAYMGRHTNLAARIEPIAGHGHVYVSGEFAAIATVKGAAEFRFEYVGQHLLPKNAGLIPVYRLLEQGAEDLAPKTLIAS